MRKTRNSLPEPVIPWRVNLLRTLLAMSLLPRCLVLGCSLLFLAATSCAVVQAINWPAGDESVLEQAHRVGREPTAAMEERRNAATALLRSSRAEIATLRQMAADADLDVANVARGALTIIAREAACPPK